MAFGIAMISSILLSLNESHIFVNVLLLSYVTEFQIPPDYTVDATSSLLERFAPRSHQLERLRRCAAPAVTALLLSVTNFYCIPCDADHTSSYSINHIGDFMNVRLMMDFMFRWLLDLITVAFLKIVSVQKIRVLYE